MQAIFLTVTKRMIHFVSKTCLDMNMSSGFDSSFHLFQESYVALEKAIRSLASFYSKDGPFATLSQEVKEDILDDLSTAEANL